MKEHQEAAWSEQVFHNRFTTKLCEVHEREMHDRKVKVDRANSGVAWMRAVKIATWVRVHEM